MKKYFLLIPFLLSIALSSATILLDVPPYVAINDTIAFRSTCTWNNTARTSSNGLMQVRQHNVTYNMTYDTPNTNWKATVYENDTEFDDNTIFMCWNMTNVPYNATNVENATFFVRYRIDFNVTFNLWRFNGSSFSDSDRLFAKNNVWIYGLLINGSDINYNYSYTLTGTNSAGFLSVILDPRSLDRVLRLIPYYPIDGSTIRPKLAPDGKTYFWSKLTNGQGRIRFYEAGDYQLFLIENKVTGDVGFDQFERPQFMPDEIGFETPLEFYGKKVFPIQNKTNRNREYNIYMDYFEVNMPAIYRNIWIIAIITFIYLYSLYKILKLYQFSSAATPIVTYMTIGYLIIIGGVLGHSLL